MPTPKAIFYDLDGTLRKNQPAGRDLFAEHAIRLGLEIVPEDCLRSARWEHAYWASSEDLRADLACFGDGDPAFWRNYSLRQLLALGCSQDQANHYAPLLSDYMDVAYQPQDLLFEDAAQTLSGLRQNGYILAVVSNRHQPFHDYLREKEILDYLHFALAAGEVNSWKPDPEIFLQAARRANLEPGAVVYVGDNYYADVVGARRAGLIPVLFDPGKVFPEADCLVIQTHAQIFDLLERI
ncbi:MAG: HAD family hydrolase [Anaerolineales bacterium]|nr:HAD family hydrolase [Anaerolineales bacterium]